MHRRYHRGPARALYGGASAREAVAREAWGVLQSPLTDSNRRPPPYHRGAAGPPRRAATANHLWAADLKSRFVSDQSGGVRPVRYAATHRSRRALSVGRRPRHRCSIARLMDLAEREAMARAIVDGNGYMTLGTADADGLPWASPVWYAPASYREFFWVSKPGARHSQNIAVRPEVGIVIFDSTVPMGTGRAVYLAARAEQVTAAGEIERGMTVFSRRSLERGGRGWTPDDVGPDSRLRLYRATASEQFVLSPEDERLPFHLE